MAQIRLFNSIEYLTGDLYAITEDRGETQMPRSLDLAPDSPEWFTWLDSLQSFHFKGRLGHFTARHEEKKREKDAPRLFYWYAYRKAYGKQHKHYLGATPALTLANLEQTAQDLYTAVLGSLPDDEVLNARAQRESDPQGVKLGSLTFLWHDDMLLVRSPSAGAHYLSQRQTSELLTYLYEHRTTILKGGK